MNIVALITVHNEIRMIRACLDHLVGEGINFFIINDRCTDGTMKIVDEYSSRGLLGVAHMADNDAYFNLSRTLKFKTSICQTVTADWFIHADADEFRTSNRPGESLAAAISRIDREGYNAINFQEFTFIPVEEQPEHQPATFLQTMRWYYPFLPQPLHRLNAWKNIGQEIDLITDGGHRVHFADRKVYHESLHLRHYLYISRDHFSAKYKHRCHQTHELEKSWHGWREKTDESWFYCAPEKSLRRFDPERPWLMDASAPLHRHMLEERFVRG